MFVKVKAFNLGAEEILINVNSINSIYKRSKGFEIFLNNETRYEISELDAEQIFHEINVRL